MSFNPFQPMELPNEQLNERNLKIYAICCTYNRHRLLERAVSMFLQQDYVNRYMLIFNNSPIEQKLATDVCENIILVNNHISYRTLKPYDNTGDIFSDALSLVPKDVDVICWFDDDDIFLPNHLSEGVKGFKEALELGKVAYKPKYSWFRYMDQPQILQSNTMEPSIFIHPEWVRRKGFATHSSAYHQQWEQPLVKEDMIYIKPDGEPTFIYDWSSEASAFKISGDGDNPHNFNRHKEHSGDIGDRIITPYKYNYEGK